MRKKKKILSDKPILRCERDRPKNPRLYIRLPVSDFLGLCALYRAPYHGGWSCNLWHLNFTADSFNALENVCLWSLPQCVHILK